MQPALNRAGRGSRIRLRHAGPSAAQEQRDAGVVRTGLAPASKELVERDKLLDRVEGVLVDTLLGSTVSAEHLQEDNVEDSASVYFSQRMNRCNARIARK